ncbi:MAG: alpha/beta hydrolase family protein [Blastocatellia bacterium]
MKPRTPAPAPPAVSRRDLLRGAIPGALGLAAPGETAPPEQNPANPSATPVPPPLNRFPRMVQEYFVARVRDIERQALQRKNALRTKADAAAYVHEARQKARACFGPLPEKTPLRARVTGVVERDTYRIEKVIFESRPGFLVTANLYIPKNKTAPMPGVIGTCGHSANGKAIDTYQSFVQGLARQGYVVLIFDPIGQGERLQYVDEKLQSRIGAGVAEHNHLGNQMVLVGENLAFWRAWDGIRALDYLLTRPEVDQRHIGLTGNSGGGTTAAWLCALDDRWTMAAPGCFVTTMRRNLENELPQDNEQYVHGALAAGLDHDDFLAALAPKPLIILAKEKDYFDARGAEEAYQRLKRLYTLLGAPDNIALHIGPTPHGYSRENREAMYRWFNRFTKVSDAAAEPPITLEKDAALQCTPRGQVSTLGSRTVYSFTAEKARALAARRGPLTVSQLARAVTDILNIPAMTAVPDARILRRLRPRGYPKPEFTTYAVETEPGIHALVCRLSDEQHYSRPARGQTRAVLYVAHHSADAELRAEPLLRDLAAAEPAAAFFTCDVRGSGESRPDTCGEEQFLDPYGSDYFYAGHALMLGRPYVGQKTFDVLRVIDWLKSYGHTDIHLVGNGWGTLPATFAALLSDTVTRVTLKNALTAYADIARAETYNWPLSSFIPNVLATFDLPDCYRALSRKQLRLL